ncbi:MAG: sigma-70 family RNA polymerase sigma factor [Candidatus Riflebacteria bacterium]|nr:sigma-70 family RNA polymerase sigma factor [Candidatus Riflebacteria bacterium]
MANKDVYAQEDALVIAEVLKGRKTSFTILVNRYQRLVRITIWNYFRKREFVDDLCQEALLKAYLNLSALREPAKFKNWLLQVTFRLCVDYQRRNRVENSCVESLGENDGILFAVNNEESFILDEASVLSLLNRLSSVDCFVVWLRYVEELSYDSIASIIDSTETAVRQKASRAMKSMRKYLK